MSPPHDAQQKTCCATLCDELSDFIIIARKEKQSWELLCAAGWVCLRPQGELCLCSQTQLLCGIGVLSHWGWAGSPARQHNLCLPSFMARSISSLQWPSDVPLSITCFINFSFSIQAWRWQLFLLSTSSRHSLFSACQLLWSQICLLFMFPTASSSIIPEALTRAGSEFDFLAGTRKEQTTLGLQGRADISDEADGAHKLDSGLNQTPNASEMKLETESELKV